MACSKCGHEINQDLFPFGTQFCPYCGERTGATDGFDPIPFCPYCGQRLLTEVTFCPQCGKSLAARPAPAVVEHIEAPAAPPAEATRPAAMAESVVDTYPIRPKARPRPHHEPPPPFWHGFRLAWLKIYHPVDRLFSSRGRLEKLYASWAQNDQLPAEEIPSPEEIKRLTRQPKSESGPRAIQTRPAETPPAPATMPKPGLSPQVVFLVCLALVIIFVVVGVLIKGTM